MNEFWTALTGTLTTEHALGVVRAVLLAIAGLPAAKLISTALLRTTDQRIDAHKAMVLRRGSYYLVLALFLLSALKELGFNLNVLLGAAGILTVAVGFASQTSAANIISGLFLIAEKPFTIGDTIKVGNTIGEVLSIDLLSIKLRTFDNLFVRIPNDALIKSEVTTLTKFPIRRLNLELAVVCKEGITQVREVLSRIADANRMCLEEPKPLVVLRGFEGPAMELQFSVWVKREDLVELGNRIQEQIKAALDAYGIESRSIAADPLVG